MNLFQYKLSQHSIGDNQELFHICDVDLGFCNNPSPFYLFCHSCNHLSKIFEVHKTSSQSVHKFLSNWCKQINKQAEKIISLVKEIIIAKFAYCFNRWIFLTLFTGYCIISDSIFPFSLPLIVHCVITIRELCLH